MGVLINVFLAMGFLTLFGYIFQSLLLKNQNAGLIEAPILGYILSQSLYYIYFLVSRDAIGSFFVVFVTLFIALLYVYIKDNMEFVRCHGNLKSIRNMVLISLAVCITLSFPYMYYGSEYFHTANEDIFDALNGQGYYLGYLTKLTDFIHNQQNISEYLRFRQGIEDFVTSGEAIQYSTVTFWSLFLNTHFTMEPFLVQGIVNNTLMILALFILFNKVIGLSEKPSWWIAVLPVICNLWFTTYVNGHEGSTIFGSLIPYILYLAIPMKSHVDKPRLLIMTVSVLLVSRAYWHPLVFFLVPLVVYIYEDRWVKALKNVIYKRWFQVGAILIIIMALFSIYLVFQYYTVLQEGRFRSWGISFVPEMLLVYWGLLQSQVSEGAIINNYIYPLVSVKYSLYVLVFFLLSLTIYGLSVLIKINKYFLYFIIMWLVSFALLRWGLKDSYYFYKFLYTTQFMIVSMCVVGWYQIYIQRKSVAKGFLYSIAGISISANVVNNVLTNYVVTQLPWNKNYSEFESIVDIPDVYIKNSFLDIPRRPFYKIATLFLRRENLLFEYDPAKAKYILLSKKAQDVTHNNNYSDYNGEIFFENEAYKVIENRNKNMLYVSTARESQMETENAGNYYDPLIKLITHGTLDVESIRQEAKRDQPMENQFVGNFSEYPFRWITNSRHGVFTIKGMTNKSYIRFCLETGPGIDHQPFALHTSSGQNKKIMGASCKLFTIPEGDVKQRFWSNVKGKKLLPYDDRELNYRIGIVGLVNEKYDIEALQYLNPNGDVLDNSVGSRLHDGKVSENTVLLWNGWYARERSGMRWAANDMEILVIRPTKKFIDINLELEPGPSLTDLPLKMNIINEQNDILGKVVVSSRQNIKVKLPVNIIGKSQIYRFKILNKSRATEYEPRLLNVRLFRIQQDER